MKEYLVIGLMSGTSLDGIDVALLRTDGEGYIQREGFLTVPYDDALRSRIRDCFNLGPDEVHAAAEAERALTIAHAEAVKALLARENIRAEDVQLIGFHGQTISHAPEHGFTCQIGDGPLLARLTGIPVVNDFRTADVKAGGHGAPLVPVYHQALAAGQEKPVAFLNIGGVANVTFVGSNGEVIAFDTGAGNALIDDWMLKKTGRKFDACGETAAQGSAQAGIVAAWMENPYFKAAPPKSLDRNAFDISEVEALSVEDGAATLTAFTVEGIVRALDHLPEKPHQWVVSGGGRLNETMMRGLEQRLGVPVVAIEAHGLNGDAIEAEAFGYLAVRSIKGLPISFPKTTGAPRPMQGGKLHPFPPGP